MSVLTETEIRKRLRDKDLKLLKEYEVEKGVIVTPSAKGYLSDNNIQLKIVEKIKEINEPVIIEKEVRIEPKFRTIFGGYLDSKPEHMTHLNGNLLVFKNHSRIILRGKFDSLESQILQVQILSDKLKHEKLTNDLEEILGFVRNLLRAEVLEEKLNEFKLLDMDEKELREKSHHPKKYYGMGHFQPSYKNGEIVVALNSLRSATREVELASYNAFKTEYGDVEREDIVRALNRLSSLFWIMMFKFLAGEYTNKEKIHGR
ncbi:cobalamin adenosyltransferase [Clostridium gasigenes]|uniref:Ethanolamine utilization cobalamin adenosyltransferase n=1 Tax=Clostridium gasigenes TaxID=94869 RepID=A0A1H0VB66_9CLOT|nr:cobalamin adenosyltransferase [Clostridium gasigenes]MBB6624359.1 cobalamin adenosyltransferase [Clostridium gasigenes]MBU3088746.1 cobalamin adenosyltransferase [Clostridium gasigenes]MBU3105635.1 cobalamin adenosyltransferase [Clostridium gasigenes]MBU3132285.1 cobalamin adenosyltransferase [Clostridium gasigenes]NKF06819.1 cobalamin adenosyltransferase [Clostridium gasigenes]